MEGQGLRTAVGRVTPPVTVLVTFGVMEGVVLTFLSMTLAETQTLNKASKRVDNTGSRVMLDNGKESKRFVDASTSTETDKHKQYR